MPDYIKVKESIFKLVQTRQRFEETNGAKTLVTEMELEELKI